MFELNRLYVFVVANSTSILLRPSFGVSCLVVSPMAAGTSFLSSEMVNRRLLGPKPNFFNWRCSFAAGDLPPFLKIPLVLMLVCATAMAGCSVRKYVEFCDKGIIEQRALALFPKEHLYSQVRAVTMSHYYSFSRGRAGTLRLAAHCISFSKTDRAGPRVALTSICNLPVSGKSRQEFPNYLAFL